MWFTIVVPSHSLRLKQNFSNFYHNNVVYCRFTEINGRKDYCDSSLQHVTKLASSKIVEEKFIIEQKRSYKNKLPIQRCSVRLGFQSAAALRKNPPYTRVGVTRENHSKIIHGLPQNSSRPFTLGPLSLYLYPRRRCSSSLPARAAPQRVNQRPAAAPSVPVCAPIAPDPPRARVDLLFSFLFLLFYHFT